MRRTLSHLGEKETGGNYRWQNSALLFKTNTSPSQIVKTAAGAAERCASTPRKQELSDFSYFQINEQGGSYIRFILI